MLAALFGTDAGPAQQNLAICELKRLRGRFIHRPPEKYMKSTPMLAALFALITAQGLAQTVPPSAPIDGVGNNTSNPNWGSAGSDLLRLAPAGYADGIFSPSLPNNLSARLISNILNNQTTSDGDVATVDDNSLSDFGYAYGQFIDHDMDLTPDGGAPFFIPMQADDPIGPQPLPFLRSLIDPATGVSTPGEQVNIVTSYLDLSQVYGSRQAVADALRTFQAGRLKTSPGNMLPFVNSTYFTADQISALHMANDAQAVPESELFATGDRRGNENLELSVLETLFVRNHNRLAGLLQVSHPAWTDEQLYQEARRLNIAQYQSTIYNEWLPAVFGPTALSSYRGYNASVNASIANEFSTAAFRFGHSMLSADIERKGNDGMDVAEEIPLAVDFFNPHLLNPARVVDPLTGLTSSDIGPVLKSMASANGQAMDLLAVGDVRNLLFGNGGEGGDDLMARDVQRGRDNGLPDYNTVRMALGLPPVSTFAQVITQTQRTQRLSPADSATQTALVSAYPGGVGTIDLFEGGLAEHPVRGSDVGPTFQAIMVDQFERLRDGDRFFYLNQRFNAEELVLFQQANTLAKIITANTEITNLQANVMLFTAQISGTVSLRTTTRLGTTVTGASAVIVQLHNSDGDVVATTKTDGRGQYSFDELSGPAPNLVTTPGVSGTGTYTVSLVLPRGTRQLNAQPGAISISRGGARVGGVNFMLGSIQTSTSGSGGRR